MARARRDTDTLDLLAWAPPEPVRAYPEERVRAADLRSMVSKAVSNALRECGKPRDEIAAEMSEYLGEDVPGSMLDAYASEAREKHSINLVRFLALAHATGDAQPLLQLLAAHFGLAVIPDRYLPAIEDAIIADKIEELSARQKVARRNWRGPR